MTFQCSTVQLCPLKHHDTKAYGEVELKLHSFLTPAPLGGEWSVSCLATSTLSPWGKKKATFTCPDWVSSLGPVWTGVENLHFSLEFDPRTFQPLASRYTDFTIPAHSNNNNNNNTGRRTQYSGEVSKGPLP